MSPEPVAFLDPRSKVVETDDGWAWLCPERRSLHRRQTLAWTLLTLALGAGAAAVAFLDPVPATLTAVAALLVAVALVQAAARAAHTRAGACHLGLLLQMGPRIVQAGWSAIDEVRAVPAGHGRVTREPATAFGGLTAGRGRVRLVVATDQGPTHATRATFDNGAVRTWLRAAAAAARRAGRSVVLLDGGPGFAVR